MMSGVTYDFFANVCDLSTPKRWLSNGTLTNIPETFRFGNYTHLPRYDEYQQKEVSPSPVSSLLEVVRELAVQPHRNVQAAGCQALSFLFGSPKFGAIKMELWSPPIIGLKSMANWGYTWDL